MVSAVTAAAAAAELKKPVAEDDFESQQKRNVRQPEMCVDYLSYKFDEMDLAASWRVMTKQKKDVVDGIRLENASWRTWAKQRNNLKTISPQTLNWLKDSDVTWLYGPLHTVIRTEEDPFLTPRKATTEETLGLMLPLKNQKPEKKPVLKSALKKVTTVDLLKRSATELSSLNSSSDTASLEQKPKHHRKISISEVNNQLHAISPAVLATHRQPKLRFNHEVEQCIALTDEERYHEDIEEDDDEQDDSSEGDEDTDQIITTHITYSGSYSDYGNSFSHRKSIKKIAPARLKKSQSDGDTDDVSSISSTSTVSSVGCITRSPAVTSPVVFDEDLDDDDDDDLLTGLEEEDSEDDACHIQQSFYNRPTPGQSLRDEEPATKRPIIQTTRSSSSSNSITQSYKEKSNVAEPALVTMHQTATDIHSSKNSTLFNNIATWAASYLWPNESSNNTISRSSSPFPQHSASTSIIPSKSSSAIPIERPFAHPTSSNSSSL